MNIIKGYNFGLMKSIPLLNISDDSEPLEYTAMIFLEKNSSLFSCKGTHNGVNFPEKSGKEAIIGSITAQGSSKSCQIGNRPQ